MVAAAPTLEAAWLAYGDVLVDLEKYPDARIAFERARLADPHRPRIEEATAALVAEDRKKAERIFRDILQGRPEPRGGAVRPRCRLTRREPRAGCRAAAAPCAQAIRARAARLARTVPGADRAGARAGGRRGRAPAAEDRTGESAELGAARHRVHAAHAPAGRAGGLRGGGAAQPGRGRLRLSIGHVQKTLGTARMRGKPTRRAWRSIPPWARPTGVWRISRTTSSATRRSPPCRGCCRARPARIGQAQLHFALGRAFEHRQEYQGVRTLRAGNALRRKTAPFDIEYFEAKTRRVREFFDAAILCRPRSAGVPNPAPIFIVGLPRSGSTLVEQILASHSQVEGTMELPNILTIVREFDHANREHEPTRKACGIAPGASPRSAGATSRRPRRCAPGGSTSSTKCPTTSATSA